MESKVISVEEGRNIQYGQFEVTTLLALIVDYKYTGYIDSFRSSHKLGVF